MNNFNNPIIPGWYADPEARFYEGKYWIYATRSFSAYEDQLNIDAFSSSDLVTWEKHEGIIVMEDFPWAHKAIWAPTIIDKNGKYYLIFASNDIQSDAETGGLEIAVSDRPQGPFRAILNNPLVDRFINKAQPIDAHLFKDDDGAIYLYYGGWKYCNAAIMNEEMNGFIPFEDGVIFKNITPDGYVEAPCMLKRNGIYYFMWSEGDWVNGSYRVCCSSGNSPLPNAEKKMLLLQAQPIADGPGHHGYLKVDGAEDEWLIVYHRRTVGDLERGHRMLCIDQLRFEGDEIQPVIMT